MKLVFAAPASTLPFLSTALLSQVSCASAEPTAKVEIKATEISVSSFPPLARLRESGFAKTSSASFETADNHSFEYWNAGNRLSPSFVPPGSTIFLSTNLRLS